MGKLLGAFALGLVVAAGVVILMRPAKETPPPVQPSEVTQSAVPSAPSEPEPEAPKAAEPEHKWRRTTDPRAQVFFFKRLKENSPDSLKDFAPLYYGFMNEFHSLLFT